MGAYDFATARATALALLEGPEPPDAIFCANSNKTLNDFLEWDWIGAPWSKDATYGGNGGLSLRRVSKILQVLDEETRPPGDSALEDLWLTTRINNLKGARMPYANVSKTFSVESVWDEQPLGYHIGWLGVHHEQVSFPTLQTHTHTFQALLGRLVFNNGAMLMLH